MDGNKKKVPPVMDLRDYFAGQALACNQLSSVVSHDFLAKNSYELADEMLKVRSITTKREAKK